MRTPVILAALALAATPAAAQTCAQLILPGDPRGGLHGDPDLRCFELTATPAAIGLASGRVELLQPPGPFTVAVDPDGAHVWSLRLTLDSLPDPRVFDDDARVYVAWVTTPALDPFEKLGVVQRGAQTAGRAAFDKFIVMISAEVDDTVSERRGPLVLRGTSPSMRLQPEHTPWLLSMTLPDGGAGHGVEEAVGHAQGHAHAQGSADAWPHPAMPSDIVMLSAMMPRLPTVSPYWPNRTAVSEAGHVRPDAPASATTLAAGPNRGTDGFSFNAGTPGPTIRVRQGSSLDLRFRNATDLPMTIHWHGLRVANAFDGVAHHTQQPVEPGESFDYKLEFPDAGVFWYHPHERADVAQDLGLYGNIVVEPASADAPNTVNAELALMLDDMLLTDDGARMPHGREAATHALMGRFGDVLLINGDSTWETTVSHGAIVRFLL